MVQLEGHPDWPPSAIYSSTKSIAATWPWIGEVYSEDHGGHAGWLGFPLTDEQDYAESTLQMFERGYIVYYTPGIGEDRDWSRTPVAYPYLTSYGTLFNVQANQSWQSTGSMVKSGDLVTLLQIGGEWTYVTSEEGTVDANGDVGWDDVPEDVKEDLELPSAFVGALIGRIGEDAGHVFPVGRWSEFISLHQGTLYLAMNDNEYEDNAGSIAVQIVVEPAE
jgi:hypothetical protein